MILLIDIGNSNIKWISYDEKNNFDDAVVIPLNKTTFQADLENTWSSMERPDQILVSNVAGPTTQESLCEWTLRTWNIEPKFVKSEQANYGIHNAYEDPTQLGVDRWLNLIAANLLGLGDICVFSCGSAITMDVLTEQGQHKGGAIIPGITIMRQLLVLNTHAVQSVSELQSSQTSLVATNTDQGVINGTLHAAVAFIDYSLEMTTKLLNRPVKGVITGGDSAQLLPYIKSDYTYEPNLLFRGLVKYSET